MSGYAYRQNEKTPATKKEIHVSPEIKALLDQAKKAVAELKASNAAVLKEKEALQESVEDLQTKNKSLTAKNAHLNKQNSSLTSELEQANAAAEQAKKELAEELDKNLLERLQDAYAKNNKLIEELVTKENSVKPTELLEEENASLKQQNQALEVRIVELESFQQSLMQAASEPVEEAVIFTGELQQVTLKGAPIPVSGSTLSSLAGSKLQFTVVAP